MNFSKLNLGNFVVFALLILFTSCEKDLSSEDQSFYDPNENLEDTTLETRDHSTPITVPQDVQSMIQNEYPGFIIKKAKQKHGLSVSYEVEIKNSIIGSEYDLYFDESWELVLEKGESRLYSNSVPDNVKLAYPGYSIKSGEVNKLNGVTTYEIEFSMGGSKKKNKGAKKEVIFDEDWNLLLEKVKTNKTYLPLTSLPLDAVSFIESNYEGYSAVKVKSYGTYYEVEIQYGDTDIDIDLYFSSSWKFILAD